MVLWVGLQCVILVFPDHTHLLLHAQLSSELVFFLNSSENYLCTGYTEFEGKVQKVSEYDQEIQSHTADHPTAS